MVDILVVNLHRAEKPKGSSKLSAFCVDSSNKKRKEEPIVNQEVLDCNYARFYLTKSGLVIHLSSNARMDNIEARLSHANEMPNSPLVEEVALRSWFFDCGLRLPFALFV